MIPDNDWQLDVDLLGVKEELTGFLSERGFTWFEDYIQIEADLGNGELKVCLLCPWERFEPHIMDFAELHRFKRVFYVPSTGAVFLRRRNDK